MRDNCGRRGRNGIIIIRGASLSLSLSVFLSLSLFVFVFLRSSCLRAGCDSFLIISLGKCSYFGNSFPESGNDQ